MSDAPDRVWIKYAATEYRGARGLLITDEATDGYEEFTRADLDNPDGPLFREMVELAEGVKTGPMEGEIMEMWIRTQMHRARAVLDKIGGE